jgi:hypothetical protein
MRRSLLILFAAFIASTISAQPGVKKSPSLDIGFGGGEQARLVLRSGGLQVGFDKALNGPLVTSDDKLPLVLESPADQDGPREVRALVRLRTDRAPIASAVFSLAKKDAKDPGLRMGLTLAKDADVIHCQVTLANKPLHNAQELSQKLDWLPEVHNGLSYYPRAYPLADIRPGWPEDFRQRIEYDMAGLPAPSDKWLSVRIELKPGQVRCWLDDRLVAHKSDPEIVAAGLTQITLSPGAQLAAYDVQPWQPTRGYLPIHLEGYAQGRTFLTSTLKPDALTSSTIDGVPFVIPKLNSEGRDHLDISRSLYRQANAEGYAGLGSTGHRWCGSERRDPARIQLRVPNGSYDSLYLIATATGEPNTVPLVTAQFFRPHAGFAENFEATVPLATVDSKDATPIPVTLANGKQVNLWKIKIPLDPGRLSSFGDLDIVEIELTKKVQLYRSYPDPILYGWHQAGLPSSVHVFAATLGEAPVSFELIPDKFGHVWTAPDTPSYTLKVTNRTDRRTTSEMKVTTRSYDGSERTAYGRPVALEPGQSIEQKLSCSVKLNGYNDIVASLTTDGREWVEKRSFVRLAPDTRSERWTGKGGLFGYWSYGGGHHTPKGEHHIALMTMAGARTGIGASAKSLENPWIKKHWSPVSAGAWEVSPQPWAAEEPYDQSKYAEYQKDVIAKFTKARAAMPPELRPDHVYFFPEPHVSNRLTEGNYASYWGEPEEPYTPEEKTRLRMFMVTAKCAAEAVRKEFPELKILIPWGNPLFSVPLLRAGFPKDLIDGSGLDVPNFERLPEMQTHQDAVQRIYQLRKEFEKAGIKNPQLQYNEGIFVPTEPGAVSPREQMDIYNRWVLVSMAHGVKRFYSGWFVFDCGNYYGSEHYGGCGIQRRIPYCDPKPAYAAYATMTDRLNDADFESWMPTGSQTTYCLRFGGPKGKVHTLYTIRGKRPVTLTLADEGDVHVTDAMNNTQTVKTKGKTATILTDPSVVYVTATTDIVSAAVGDPDHKDARPATDAKLVADLADGSWSFNDKRDELYEKGSFGMARALGKFSAAVVPDQEQGKVLRSKLEKQEKVRELMPWYNVLTSKKKLVLPGAPSHLGLWVKGASDWGRVIYVLRDAKGEKWTSIGFQDQYNCDDVHSWSAFNFDGWRYVRFELPGHTGADSFRKHGTTWWRSDGGDGIVDLPLTLESIIVEQRTHVIYVNDVRPVASDTVLFGKLYAEYVEPADAAPLALVHAKLRTPLPKGVVDLPNPIAKMEKDNTLEPTKLVKLVPPLEHNDGTMVHVHFATKDDAKKHFVWVGVRPDGRGAVNLTPAGTKDGAVVRGLRPALPLYFWVTYVDAQGRMSRPSAAMTATLEDTFSQK